MPIELETSRPASVPASAEIPSAHRPFKPIPITDNVRSLANADDTDGMCFCYWLGNKFYAFFQSILSFLGIISKVERVENCTASLERRINGGAENITRHFNDKGFNDLDPAKSAVMVIIKYNLDNSYSYEAAVQFDRLTVGKEKIKEAALQKLREALSNDQEFDGLTIQTLIFSHDGNDCFNYTSLGSEIEFPYKVIDEISSKKEKSKEFILSLIAKAISNIRNSRDVVPKTEIEQFMDGL